MTKNKLRVVLKLSSRTHLNAAHFKQLKLLPVDKREVQVKMSISHDTVNKSAYHYPTILV